MAAVIPGLYALYVLFGGVVAWWSARADARARAALNLEVSVRHDLADVANDQIFTTDYYEGTNPRGPCHRHGIPLSDGCSEPGAVPPDELMTLEYRVARNLYFPFSGKHISVTRGQCFPATYFEERAVKYCPLCREAEVGWLGTASPWSTSELANNVALLKLASAYRNLPLAERQAPNNALQRTRFARR